MTKDEIKTLCENDLEAFIRLVHPNRVLGSIHQDIIHWWRGEESGRNNLVMLPRDHQKSALLGYRCAQAIVKNPAIRILYISSTANLAIKQLKFIKDILTSPKVRQYWPELVNLDEAKREKWTETEISVDHPKRKAEYVRDPTVFTAGLTTNIVGLHADVIALDDVVVHETAYTEEGRKKLETQYSFLASIGGTDGEEWAVGTRYHPKDLYNTLRQMRAEIFDEEGNVIGHREVYAVREHAVEDRGDGTGEFLWPRQQRGDGKWFGFDRIILAEKRSKYIDQVQFRAQYYNDPNDLEGAGIKPEHFQYYDRQFLNKVGGQWTYKGTRLNVFASVDFAYSLSKDADFTTIVVVGVDHAQNFYVLDIDRFKAQLPSVYFQHILRMYQKWDFRKIKAEVTAAQEVIVKDLKMSYIRKYGLALSVDEHRPTRNDGNKRERTQAVLQPRYTNRQIWHYQGGNCQVLEEELVLSNPAHDDVKDALAVCVDACVAPAFHRVQSNRPERVSFHTRFGGVL